MIGGKTGRLAVRIAIGLLAGVALAAVVVFIVYRDQTPELTQADFAAAQQRWDQRAPKSYDLELTIEGNRPGPVHVEVRDGQVTHMTRDGVEPKQRRTWDVWSVSGMFETIELELDKAGNPVEGFQAPQGSRMVQRALFDPQYGYPAKYHRIILGSNLELRWQVTQFVSLDPILDPPVDLPPSETGRR